MKVKYEDRLKQKGREQERIFDAYGDTRPHIGRLGGGTAYPTGIYSAADRVSDEV